MKIETKFDIGDKIIEILSTTFTKRESCPVCNGTGNIFIKNYGEQCCPKCYGKGYEQIYGQEAWRIADADDNYGEFYSRPIGRIEIKIEGKRSPNIEVYYMRKNTGNKVNENNCFQTKEEAQKECDKRNAELDIVNKV